MSIKIFKTSKFLTSCQVNSVFLHSKGTTDLFLITRDKYSRSLNLKREPRFNTAPVFGEGCYVDNFSLNPFLKYFKQRKFKMYLFI